MEHGEDRMAQTKLVDCCELEVKSSCVTCEFIQFCNGNGEMEPDMAQVSRPNLERNELKCLVFKNRVKG